MNDVIVIKNLTKDFGKNRGIFDINLSIHKGECFGLIGINGSGKSTIMRHLMGFLHPNSGTSTINDLDCWKNAEEIKKITGYIPGEISFPDCNSGLDFLKLQSEYMDNKDLKYANELIKKMSLDPTARLKRMSKGMKQKTAIVNSFMCDSEILLLDEPTTGLDPLMQKSFTEIIKFEKDKGKTIFMSSHLFSEMEETCDRVAFLKNGHIIEVVDMKTICGGEKQKTFKIEFNNSDDYNVFITNDFNITRIQEKYNQVSVLVNNEELDKLINTLKKLDVKYITHIPYTLEECFKDIYNKSENNISKGENQND